MLNAKNFNLHDLSMSKGIMFDAVLVFAGLSEYEKSTRLFDIINSNIAEKFVLISDDPRCLYDMSHDERLTRVPDIILTQFEGTYYFKKHPVVAKYIPIETALAYGHKGIDYDGVEKETPFIVVANTAGERYDRAGIAANMVTRLRDVPIYGRLSAVEQSRFIGQNVIGEVSFNEISEAYSKSLCTLLVPIDEGLVTGKYVEALMNSCLPIFHKDYNVEILKETLADVNLGALIDVLTVSNASELEGLVTSIERSHRNGNGANKLMAEFLYDGLIGRFFDGAELANTIVKACLEVPGGVK